jgi:gluconolactonase
MRTTEVTPVLIGRGLKFAEGVNFDRDGTLFCVDVEGGGIWRMPPGGELREWVRTGGNPNGSRFGPGGGLFVADCGRRAILRLDTSSGAMSVYAAACDGQPFAGPNDLCFGPDGVVYFTDPEGSTLENRAGAVYAVAPDGTVTRLASGLAYPNGIVVTPDGAALVVAETFTGVLHRYSLAHPDYGTELDPLAVLSPAREVAPVAGPDGMAFDAEGYLYVAHAGTEYVRVLAPDGSIVASLPAGGASPTNVAFWDESLYVTEGESGSVYRLDIGVREQRPFMREW